MKEIRHKSAVPYYGAAAVLILYALLFPLYRFGDYLLFLGAGCVVFFVLRKAFPGKTERVKIPVTTGDADTDALLREGETAVIEMTKLLDTIKGKAVREKIYAIIEVTDKIFKNVIEDPTDYKQVRRFADFYLPTTMKLLHAYDRFGRSGTDGEHIDATLARIEDALDQIHASYLKQYDALFKNQALDIETDIIVLESMLKKEGLTGSDFN
jgi:hypothetical protein